jgi:hypothetical protein
VDDENKERFFSYTRMLMEVLAWNTQGLNDPLKQKEVQSSVRRLKVAIIWRLELRR